MKRIIERKQEGMEERIKSRLQREKPKIRRSSASDIIEQQVFYSPDIKDAWPRSMVWHWQHCLTPKFLFGPRYVPKIEIYAPS